MTLVLLKVNESSHKDIHDRIEKLGPIYTADFFKHDERHGLVIVFGEVGLVIDKETTNVQS